MDYSYSASGGLAIIGSVLPTEISRRYSHKFAVGTRPYVLEKARKGKLERITIKKVNMVRCGNPSKSGIQPIFNYVDSFNEVWLEDELGWQGEVVPIAIEFWEKVKDTSVLSPKYECEIVEIS